MSDLNPCWKCGSPGVIDENGGYMFVTCTNIRKCSNSRAFGFDVHVWNNGGLSEVESLRQQLHTKTEEALKNTLSGTEIESLLNEWMRKTRALEAQLNSLMGVTGCNPEAPLIDAISQVQEMLCKMIADKTAGDEAMLSDWWLSHDFGQQPMAVRADGSDWRDLKTNADMAEFILEVAR